MSMMIKTTLAEQAYQELRARIVSGQLRGGERLLPNELAAELGISPTPIKEACVRLEVDGLVVVSSRRGMVVRCFTEADVEELYAARMLLEKGAITAAFDGGLVDDKLIESLKESLEIHRLYAARTSLDDLAMALANDRNFHRALVGAAGIAMISGWHGRILGQTHTVFVSVPGGYSRSVQEHADIFEAILVRDKHQTLEALERHLSRSRKNTLQQVRVLEKQLTGVV
ncbi:MAG: GntR family transcriptional regulator [Phyllobacterium sp.]